MKKIVVLGGGGYIGIPTCHALVAAGYSVVSLDRYFFGKYPEGCDIVRADTRAVTASNFAGADCVIDLAGLSNDATAEIDEGLTREINIGGAFNCIKSAIEAGVGRYIYSSSASVYGHGKKDNLAEGDDVNPLTAYAKSKVAVEALLAGEQMEYVSLRNATVFGLSPRMRFDLAINVMTARAWKENDIYVMGGGNQQRPFIHVNDLVRAFVFMVGATSSMVSRQVFNVGFSGLNFTIKQVAEMVRNRFRSARLHMIPDNPDERSYHLSFDKISKVIPDWRPRWSVGRGIGEIIDALESGSVSIDDPSTVTLKWYKTIMEWDRRLNDIRIDGRIL